MTSLKCWMSGSLDRELRSLSYFSYLEHLCADVMWGRCQCFLICRKHQIRHILLLHPSPMCCLLQQRRKRLWSVGLELPFCCLSSLANSHQEEAAFLKFSFRECVFVCTIIVKSDHHKIFGFIKMRLFQIILFRK